MGPAAQHSKQSLIAVTLALVLAVDGEKREMEQEPVSSLARDVLPPSDHSHCHFSTPVMRVCYLVSALAALTGRYRRKYPSQRA